MKKVLKPFVAFVLLSHVVGCSDTPDVLCHDLLVFWNEMADNMLRANDEATAKRLLDKEFKALEMRYDGIKKRMAKNFHTLDKDKDLQKDLRNAWYDYDDETVATGQRLFHTRQRLQGIIDYILEEDMRRRQSSTPDMTLVRSLTAVRDQPTAYLLQFSPAPDPNKQDGPAPPPPPPTGKKVGGFPIVTGIAGTQIGNDPPRWGAGLLPEPPRPKPKKN